MIIVIVKNCVDIPDEIIIKAYLLREPPKRTEHNAYSTNLNRHDVMDRQNI